MGPGQSPWPITLAPFDAQARQKWGRYSPHAASVLSQSPWVSADSLKKLVVKA
jgi:hypothetical protein